ncbi:hypothetical protein Hanom_Chr04g00343171 [Helianthus anomalus]
MTRCCFVFVLAVRFIVTVTFALSAAAIVAAIFERRRGDRITVIFVRVLVLVSGPLVLRDFPIVVWFLVGTGFRRTSVFKLSISVSNSILL